MEEERREFLQKLAVGAMGIVTGVELYWMKNQDSCYQQADAVTVTEDYCSDDIDIQAFLENESGTRPEETSSSASSEEHYDRSVSDYGRR